MDGKKLHTQELEEWCLRGSQISITAPFAHLCLIPGYLSSCKHDDNTSAAKRL